MTAPAKVIFLGLDACDINLVKKFTHLGLLPNFERLFQQAGYVQTEAPQGFYVGANWATFITGSSPSKHSFYCWQEIDVKNYKFKETKNTDIKGTPFWIKLSDRGKRVAVLDIPHIAIDSKINGIILKEWGCHDRHSGTESWPSTLVDEINHRFGAHPIGTILPKHGPQFAPCDYHLRENHFRTHTENKRLWEELQIGLQRKRAASLYLLEQGNWDLFTVVFGETHCVGHQFWHLHDKQHPRYDQKLFDEIGDPILQLYIQIDQVLGDLLKTIKDEMILYVYLSHGMGPHYDGAHLLDRLLYRLDSYKLNKRMKQKFGKIIFNSLNRFSQLKLKDKISKFLQERMNRIDRSQRSWFAVPNNEAVGAIRINLKGREPNGKISPGEEFNKVCTFLEHELMQIINVDTNELLVKKVIRSDEIYERQSDDTFPDLFVEWNRNSIVERIYSPTIGYVLEPYTHWRTGDHQSHGMLFAFGKKIQQGPGSQIGNTEDVTATLCAALNESFSEHDGTLIHSLLPKE